MSPRRVTRNAFRAAAAALGQAGCTTLSEWWHNDFRVGPNFESPPAPLPKQWIDADDPRVRVASDANLSAWWEVFADPILTRLLHDSYANNLTVRAAGSQILQAQIARSIAQSELLPQALAFGHICLPPSGTRSLDSDLRHSRFRLAPGERRPQSVRSLRASRH